MSSTHITVAGLIGILKQYPLDMLVAVPSPVHKGEEYEGILNGPSFFQVVQVNDVRSGFNPVGFHGYDIEDWPVLIIADRENWAEWMVALGDGP
jgi:hypothetical protein